jgi:gliding motility-associated-like protein
MSLLNMCMNSPMKNFLWRTPGLWLGLGFLFFIHIGYAQGVSCADTLRTIQYASPAFKLSTDLTGLTAIGTSDGGKLYFFSRQAHGVDSLVLFRTDAGGNVLWAKEINETEPTYGWFFSHGIELSNGQFVLSGGLSYWGTDAGPELSTILLLDGNGNVLWQHQYNDLGIEEGNVAFNADGQLAEGINGEIVVVGGGMQLTRLDAGGNVVASYSYAPSANLHGGAISGVQVIGGAIYTVGNYAIYNNLFILSWGIWMVKVDYATGAVDKSVFYRMNHAMSYCDSLPATSIISTVLRWCSNNQFVYALNLIDYTTCTPGNFILARLDTGLNVLPGLTEEYTIPGATSPDNEYFGINANGNVAVLYKKSAVAGSTDYAIIGDSNQIVEQRQTGITDNGSYNTLLNLPGYDMPNIYDPATALGDSLALFASSSADYVPGAGCAGSDYSLVSAASPLIATAVGITWQQQPSATIAVAGVTASAVDLPVDTLVLCSQASVCSGLSLHGRVAICLNDSVYRYTATKGAACLKMMNWTIDPLLAALTQVDDTTVTLQFRTSGQAYLYGTLAGCGLTDSLLVAVHSLAPPIHIGDDTTLCLHAVDSLFSPGAYASYVWQDGSTNAAYVVRQPGVYYVTATDFCDLVSTDTVTVQYDQSTLSAGADLQVCPLEEATLTATGGLSDYDWQPESGIVGDTTGPSVTIRTAHTMDYTVTARTDAGCQLSDTVGVVVNDCLNRLVMPGAFAPGQGGKNGTARPIAFGYLDSYDFSLYDRWGRLVFHSTRVWEGWDGTVDGMAQPGGTYVWMCRYQFAGEAEKAGKGTVILIR